ncbi:MAG TPA: TRAP transporter large permease [Candidatus Methylomirabilis sp.]|nr:TRAP transporter large permease [Candidatus Methylomirabilis sp.]HSB81331.1 TRAP transporter large permease [Candidatus Methylomirabilis sp.]
MLALLGLTFLATTVIGIPIAFGLGLAAMASILAWGQVSLWLLPQRMFTGVDSFVFMAIPFFILAGELMTTSGILDRLVKFTDALVGHIRGGLAHVNIVASMIFAGISGSAVADAAALGSVLIPSMTKEYDVDFGSGVCAGASTIGPIIPPSIPMVVYALAAGSVSIAGLFLAGVIPGVLMGVGMMSIAYVIARRRRYPVRPHALPVRELLLRFWQVLPALLMPVIIVGGILGGVFTATEAAAVAVAYAVLIGFVVTKELKWEHIPPALVRSGVTTSVVFMLIATSNAVSWILTTQQVPMLIANFLKVVAPQQWMFLLIVNIFLLIVGCLMDLSAAMIMLVPILAPIATTYGVHPLHFGFLVVLNLVIGLLTPPVGVCLFVVTGIARISLERVIRAVWPFLLWQVVVLGFVTYVPALCMAIPRLFGYQ